MKRSTPFNWELLLARLKYCGWQLLTKLFLALIYIAVIAEGIRYLMPPLAVKLHTIPGLHALQFYEATYKLDAAPFLALFLLLCVWCFWEHILLQWLCSDETVSAEGWDADSHSLFVHLFGLIAILTDAILFYTAIVHSGWSGTRFSFTALVATLAYCAVLIFVAFMSVRLRRAVLLSKQGT